MCAYLLDLVPPREALSFYAPRKPSSLLRRQAIHHGPAQIDDRRNREGKVVSSRPTWRPGTPAEVNAEDHAEVGHKVGDQFLGKLRRSPGLGSSQCSPCCSSAHSWIGQTSEMPKFSDWKRISPSQTTSMTLDWLCSISPIFAGEFCPLQLWPRTNCPQASCPVT